MVNTKNDFLVQGIILVQTHNNQYDFYLMKHSPIDHHKE